MPNEIEKNTNKDDGTKGSYYPYVLWKLFSTWLVVLFLMLLVFPNFPGDIAPGVQTLTLLGMIIYTVYFLLKRRQLAKQEK